MCELLGMSANVPTDIYFSFAGLIRRAGETGPHRDGWGIAYYEGRGARLFQEPTPAAWSELAQVVQRLSLKSRTVLCHIRQATRGRNSLENTHPFVRELWGRTWVFAHNGTVKGARRLPMGLYRPVGETDSEHAFCWLLEQIRLRYPRPPRRRETLWRLVHRLCRQLDSNGTFNMLLSDGEDLYAYCSTHLSWLTRRAPFGSATLKDADLKVNFAEFTTPDDVVTVIATRPLTTDEVWQTMSPGTLAVFRDGNATTFTPDGHCHSGG